LHVSEIVVARSAGCARSRVFLSGWITLPERVPLPEAATLPERIVLAGRGKMEFRNCFVSKRLLTRSGPADNLPGRSTVSKSSAFNT
jgi:hypothetical protein